LGRISRRFSPRWGKPGGCRPRRLRFWQAPSRSWPDALPRGANRHLPMPFARCMCDAPTPSSPGTHVLDSVSGYWIDRLDGDQDLDGVLFVESESFTNPWTKEMYAWELQNRAVCHIFVVRTPTMPVAGFCAFWLVLDEIHINNVAVLPSLRGQGIGTHLMRRVFDEALWVGVRRGALRVLGFYVAVC